MVNGYINFELKSQRGCKNKLINCTVMTGLQSWDTFVTLTHNNY